jgi:hypothetical protein
MGECGGVKTPQPGEWWRCLVTDEIVFVCGFDAEGDPVYSQHKGTSVDCDKMLDFLSDHEHLPNCTGFDWVEETYPQYWTSLDNPETSDIVYAIRSAAFNYMRATENSSRVIDAAGQDVPKKRKEDVLFHEVVVFRLGGRQLAWMENPGGMETTGNVRRVMIEVRNDREA